jgi:hypothetical protein
MLAASTGVNAFVSRVRTFFGTVTLVSLSGLLLMRRCVSAHANSLRAAVTQTSLKVRALRFGVISAIAQLWVSSAVNEPAARPSKWAFKSLKTAR